MINLLSLDDAVTLLKTGEIIAYPTESMYGLGCDPDNEKAVMNLLKLKKRSINKGLILIASNYKQLLSYIDHHQLTKEQKRKIITAEAVPVTWLCPPKNPQTYHYLTGQFNTIAIRITQHPVAQALCCRFNKAIVSTSANFSGHSPCRHIKEVTLKFGQQLPILEGHIGDYNKPSQIRDSITGTVIRT